MKFIEYKENRVHGTRDFPFAFYAVNAAHPRYYMPHHWHTEYELIHIREGSFRLDINEKEYLLSPGDTAFVGAGSLHGGAPCDCHYDCVVFDLENFLAQKTWAADIYRMLTSCEIHLDLYLPKEETVVFHCMQSICEALSSHSPGYRFTVVGCLYQLLGFILKEHLYTDETAVSLAQQKKITQLKSVLSYIASNYGEPVTLDDLAACAGMNSRYFCRAFKSIMHQTPMDYLNYYRIESACEQLATTEKSITEIALSCGFSDPCYFGKVFKKRKGVPPTHYLSQNNP